MFLPPNNLQPFHHATALQPTRKARVRAGGIQDSGPSFRPRHRRGLTLVELLMAVGILGMISAALGTLTMAVQMSNHHVMGQHLIVQQGRVAMERMRRAMNEATASEDFPGFAVFSETVSGYDFPDTLVVWHPNGSPSNPNGPPLFSELVIFCPDPSAPHQLLEITVPTDTRATPALSNTSLWQTELATIKNSTSAKKVTLVSLLRTAKVTTDANSPIRGAVRFHVRVLPSISQWDNFKSGSTDWDDLPWVQGIHGSQTGLRQTWCSIELQLLPDYLESRIDTNGEQTVPLFGSAALYHELHRPSP